MNYSEITPIENTRDMTVAFYGYNHNGRIADGEMYDMTNLTSDHFPLLSPRKKRSLSLKISDHVYDDIPVSVTKSYEASLSYAHLECKFSHAVEAYEKYLVSYKAQDIFREIFFTIREYDADGKELFTHSQNNKTSYEFQTSGETAYIETALVGIAADPESFDSTKINEYIYDIWLRKYNNIIRGILCKDGKLAYMISSTLYYDGQEYDLTDYMPSDDIRISEQKLISYGSYILIFPANIMFHTISKSVSSLGHSVSLSGTVTYQLVDRDGAAIEPTISATAPADPQNGDYWLDNGNTPGLYVYYADLMMWTPVTTTYIKVGATGLNGFKTGDAVFLNTKYEDINKGSIIEAAGEDYIIVIGILGVAADTEEFTDEDPFTAERRIPKLQHICVSNNRVWGCFYGEQNGEIVNEIYACKLADPTNWYSYAGTAADSYTLSLGDDGPFTGCITFQSYPLFFKENAIYRVYGAYPAAYQLITYDCRGIQVGSERSLTKCGEYIVYKSDRDICLFDGAYPISISEKLGPVNYKNAVGGACLNKYYISMQDEDDNNHLFVYDITKGLWHREDDLRIEEFAYSNNGQMYGRYQTFIFGFGLTSDDLNLQKTDAEEIVIWTAVTGEYGLNEPDHKYTHRITVRAYIEYHASITLLISYDGRPWEKICDMRGKNSIESKEYTVSSARCDSYRLKLTGRGEAKVYSITREEEGGVSNYGIH